MTKEQLIYECAAEAVMRARIKIAKLSENWTSFNEFQKVAVLNEIDKILFDTQQIQKKAKILYLA
ncbi:MAG: hypothetical protein AABY22_02515 [Nanoarchaeota archaeon]